MRIDEYITGLRKNNNINVSVEDGNLKIEGSRKELTKEIIEEIKTKKTDILDFFQKISGKKEYASISQAPDQQHYRLSSAQKRMYFLYELSKTSTAYNMPQVVRINGPLDKDALSNALARLIARHAILRTSFVMVMGQIVQQISGKAAFTLEQYHCEEREVHGIVKKFIRPFDLSQPPLLRAGIIELGDSDHILIVDLHHIVTDGLSQEILLKEFMAFYDNREPDRQALRYVDYAEWQQDRNLQPETIAHKDFWLNEFNGLTLVPELPSDHPRPLIKSFDGAYLDFSIGQAETSGLRAIADQEHASLFMIILSVFDLLLARVSDQEEAVIGTPVSGRLHADLTGMIGMFINTLVLRSYPQGDLTFRQFLRKVRSGTLACFEHQDYQYEDLVDALKADRTQNRNPLYDVRFVFQDFETNEFTIKGLSVNPFEIQREVSQFDLTLYVIRCKEEIRLTFNYSTELFEKETIEKWIVYFQRIISAVVADPEGRIMDIELMTAAEKDHLAIDLNNTRVDYPGDKTFAALFSDQARRTPDNPAIFCQAKGITYLELDVWSDRIAREIRQQGAVGEIAAIWTGPSLDMVAGILGILKAGLAFLPLDPSGHPERQQDMLADSRCELLLVAKGLENDVVFSGKKILIDADKGAGLPYDEYDLSYAGNDTPSSGNPGDPAYIIYTSGSTGKPKGVRINNGNLVNYARWLVDFLALTAADRSVLTSSYSFDLGYSALFPPLIAGAEVHLVPKSVYQSPEELLDYINAREITWLKLTPSLFGTLVDAKRFRKDPPVSLKYILLGGESIVATDILKALDSCAQIRFINHYGPTETTIGTIAMKIEDPRQFARQPVIGRPISNACVYIVDRYGRLQLPGVPGEICIGGKGVGEGYLRRETLTKDRFIHPAFASGARIYKTGDLGRWLPDGTIAFLGRSDEQLKIRGYRVEPGEIENQLCLYPSVTGSVVLAAEKDGNKYLVAYYISGAEIEAGDLKAFLAKKLPDYMVPLYYIRISAKPLTANGKLNSKALPQPAPPVAAERQTPLTVTEERLQGIWADLLHLEKAGIGAKDDFFELGGNSIMAIRLNYSIQQQLMADLNMRQIFENPTIEKLAEVIAESKTAKALSLRKVGKRDFYPASSAQERLFYEQSLNEDSVTFNISGAYRIYGEPDIDRLTETFRSLIALHESLRTYFYLSGDGLVQLIADNVDFSLALPEDEDHSTVREAFHHFIRPFELSKPPLIRGGLFRLTGQANYLFIDIHHIICDGVSKNILMNDFKNIYKGNKLTPPEFRYVDYACWQTDPGSQVAAQRQFWERQLSGKLPVTDLPVNRHREGADLSAAAYKVLRIENDLYEHTKRSITASSVSGFMFLLSVFYILLSKIGGNKELVVLTDVLGRTRTDLKDIVGTFVNLLPLRIKVPPEMPFRGFLEKVRECVLGAFDNQDFQYDQMISLLKSKRVNIDNIFNVHFSFSNLKKSTVETDDVKFEPVEIQWTEKTPFELKAEVREENGGYNILFIYSKELYDEGTIQLLMDYYLNILSDVVKNNLIPVGDIEAEKRPEPVNL